MRCAPEDCAMTPERCLAVVQGGAEHGKCGLTPQAHAHWSDTLLIAAAVVRKMLLHLALSL